MQRDVSRPNSLNVRRAAEPQRPAPALWDEDDEENDPSSRWNTAGNYESSERQRYYADDTDEEDGYIEDMSAEYRSWSDVDDDASLEGRALAPWSPDVAALASADAVSLERKPMPLIAPGSGQSFGKPFVRRRERPLLMRLTVLTIIVCLMFTSLLLGAHLMTAQKANSTVGLGGNVFQAQAGIAPLGRGGGAAPGIKAPGSAGLAVNGFAPNPSTSNTNQLPDPGSLGVISPAPVYPWPPQYAYMSVPGYSSFVPNIPSGYYSYSFGECTWWSQFKRQDENLSGLGDAYYWAYNAQRRGLLVGTAPLIGATVIFQPGVQGAGGVGHVAHVEKLYPDGWFLISEMNFYGGNGTNGGGWGIVDYRFAHTGYGVDFIY